MIRRLLARFRGMIFGLFFGFGLAVLFVTWRDDAFYIKEKLIIEDYGGDSGVDSAPLLTQAENSEPKEILRTGPRENERTTTDDDGTDSQNDLYKAYGHVHSILFFIGYPRSRHSLLGSLLDAHPHMVVSDEAMAFPRWIGGLQTWLNGSIYAFYDTLFGASQSAVAHGRRSRVFEGRVVNVTSPYSYYVPNQWQGQYDQYIKVIGDKSGAFTAGAMRKDKAVDAVRLLEKAAGAKVKFVHVVRNPFDNIATMVLQDARVKKREVGKHQTKVKASYILDESISRYFGWAAGCNKARQAFPGSVIDIPSLEIVKNPADTLRKICKFLSISCSERYIQDCAATVDPVPSMTRDLIDWTTEQKNRVYEEMKKYSFFDGYSYDQ